MLLQPRHQLDQIARAQPVVELVPDNLLPAVAAGAGRAGEREEIGAAGDAGGGAALDRRSADLLVAEPAEELAEAGDLQTSRSRRLLLTLPKWGPTLGAVFEGGQAPKAVSYFAAANGSAGEASGFPFSTIQAESIFAPLGPARPLCGTPAGMRTESPAFASRVG